MSMLPMLAELQRLLSGLVVTTDFTSNHLMRRVCGVDVSYHMNKAFCSAVNMNRNSFEIIETQESRSAIEFPYVSGFFMLREANPIFTTLKKIESSFDVLIVNGHGILHPRRMGLASFIGLLVDKPTIGVAKRLLCGIEDKYNYVSIDQNVCGKKLTRGRHNYVYVSVGHKISLDTSISIVRGLCREGAKLPEPLMTADILSKKSRSLSLSGQKKKSF
jgi:deoxyribonuclease V